MIGVGLRSADPHLLRFLVFAWFSQTLTLKTLICQVHSIETAVESRVTLFQFCMCAFALFYFMIHQCQFRNVFRKQRTHNTNSAKLVNKEMRQCTRCGTLFMRFLKIVVWLLGFSYFYQTQRIFVCAIASMVKTLACRYGLSYILWIE